MNLKECKDTELINLYGKLISELKERKIIRTRNIVGELGEYFAKEHYNNTPRITQFIINR